MGLERKARNRLENTLRNSSLFPACVALSYGAFNAVVPTGFFGMACLTSLADWQTTATCQIILLISTLFPHLRMGRNARTWTCRDRLTISISLLVVTLGMLFLIVYARTMPICIVSALVVGYASTGLRQFWYSQYMLIYKHQSRQACALTASMSYLPTVLLMVAFPWIAGNPRSICLAVLTTLAISLVATHAAQLNRPVSIHYSTKNTQAPYALSAYSAALLAAFGLTWGIAYGEIARTIWHDGRAYPALPLIAIAFIVAFVISTLLMGRKDDETPHTSFGFRTRCIIALSAAVWVLSPLLSSTMPPVLLVVVAAVCMAQFALMLMFSAEICVERDISLEAVTSKNCAVFYGCAAIGITIYTIVASLLMQDHFLYDALAPIAVIPALTLMPLLPSRTSSASTFTLSELPEEESLDLRIESGRRALAQSCGLTEREAQVADLLIEGYTRGEIAKKLQLSPWTIKTHTSSVYKKVDVHSNKELLRKLEEMGAGKK